MTLLMVVGLTSLGGYLAGARRLGLSRPGLGAAISATVEAIGLAVVFLGLNLGLSALGIALARAVTGGFVSVYIIDDLALAALSLLQGFVFRSWLERG